MISKRDITKFAKRIIRNQRGLRDHQMIHPRREWAVGLRREFEGWKESWSVEMVVREWTIE